MNDVLKDWSNLDIDDEKTKFEFDEMMENYDDVIRSAGYTLPENIVNLIHKYFDKNSTILDLCCGTGLVGKAFHRIGVESIYGIDFSNNIEVAKKTEVYKVLSQQNLNHLVEDSGKYDIVTMIGSLTCFDVHHIFKIINERIDFKYFVFSHRVDLIDEKFHSALEMFNIIELFNDVQYLPFSEHYVDKPVNVYVVTK